MNNKIKFINQNNIYKIIKINQKIKQKKQINIKIPYNNRKFIYKAKIYIFKKMKINIIQNNRI